MDAATLTHAPQAMPPVLAPASPRVSPRLSGRELPSSQLGSEPAQMDDVSTENQSVNELNEAPESMKVLEALIATRTMLINEVPSSAKVYTPEGAEDWQVKWIPRARPTEYLAGDVYFIQSGGRMLRSIKELKMVLGLLTIERDAVSSPQATASTLTLAERAQLDPASLIGARVCAHYSEEQCFISQVMAIRESEGPPRLRFQAHVKYEFDGNATP